MMPPSTPRNPWSCARPPGAPTNVHVAPSSAPGRKGLRREDRHPSPHRAASRHHELPGRKGPCRDGHSPSLPRAKPRHREHPGRDSVVTTTATRHPVELRYATASDVEAAPDTSRVLLALEGS